MSAISPTSPYVLATLCVVAPLLSIFAAAVAIGVSKGVILSRQGPNKYRISIGLLPIRNFRLDELPKLNT